MKIIYIMLVICGSMVVNLSCKNPFAPKLDTGNSKQSCTDLTQIENVFCTFSDAYSFKDSTIYGSIVANDFTFSYRDYDRGVDVSWGRVDEMRSTYGLFQSTQSVNLVWNNQISADSGDIRRTIIRGFNLTVTFNPGDVERVDGYANLTFARPTPNDSWKIIHWRDESNF